MIPESGRSPVEGQGNSLQYSCLGNPMDRGAWWATVYGVVKELDTTECLTHTHTLLCIYKAVHREKVCEKIHHML